MAPMSALPGQHNPTARRSGAGRIAVVGISLRVAGRSGPDGFWDLLAGGVDAIRPAPAERRAWGGDGVGPGSFLDGVERFDAAFFGISPREAAAADPQQRLALEQGWSALEDAGIVPGTLRGARAGVFVGAMRDDYARLAQQGGDAQITRHTFTGLQRSLVANRVSYFLGLRGPSLTVDTGQSSSLVAVHLAAQSLRSGECDLALAGGVSLTLVPASTREAAQFGALSPDGRCAVFDADANGFVRGEGCGFVVLKPLDRALADGDRVYCLISGSAVNHDGGGDGLTAPSRAAQEALLREAYELSGVDPAEARYVELHGTGTPVGDPVEAAALGAVLGAGRADHRPLLVGSVKTNIGHLEAAAGIAGLIKAALVVRHREVPPSLHFRTPNPDIPLDALHLHVTTARTPLDAPPGELVAGVSSFGMGGANCHVVLTEAPQTRPDADSDPDPDAGADAAPAAIPAAVPCPVSGRTAQALRGQALRLIAHVEAHPEATVPDLAYSLATTRTAFEHRAVVAAGDRDGLLAGLRALAARRRSPDLARGGPEPGARLAVLLAGQGSQRPGMGAGLRQGFPAFAEAFDEVCDHLDAHLDRPLAEVVFAPAGSPESDLLDETQYSQAAIFALEVALFRLVQSFGVSVDFVAGHSVGEVAAAHVAGVFSLPDAATLVAARGRLMQSLPDTGAMVAVQAAEQAVRDLLPRWGDQVGIAAVNGPAATVLTGEEQAVLEAAAALAASGYKTKRLRVRRAFHSPALDSVLDGYGRVVASLTRHPARIPFVSAVTGALVEPEQLTRPGYWTGQARHTVRFFNAMRALRAAGATAFLELGPDGSLSALAHDCVKATIVPALRPGRPEPRALVTALGALHCHGIDQDWTKLVPGGRRVDLPTYGFQRERYWLDAVFRTAEPISATATFADGRTHEPAATAAHPGAPSLVLIDLPPAEQARALLDLIRQETADLLGYAGPGQVGPDRTFRDLGLDSLGDAHLRSRLAELTGATLPRTVLFDHPTPQAAADHLQAALSGAHAAEAGRQTPASRTLRSTGPDSGEQVAIIGMACRYPGGVDTAEALWQLAASGSDAISTLPADRGWDLDTLYDADPDRPAPPTPGTADSSTSAAEFDAGFFGICPREALAMDPQQRLLLETAWEAVEHAGIDPAVAARHPDRRVRRRDAPRLRAARPLGRRADSKGTWSPATPPACCPAGSPTSSAWRARRSPWTRRAPPRWSPCTWPCRRCARASASWRWPAG